MREMGKLENTREYGRELGGGAEAAEMESASWNTMVWLTIFFLGSAEGNLGFVYKVVRAKTFLFCVGNILCPNSLGYC